MSTQETFTPRFQSLLEAYQKSLSSIAITAALFAGVMMSLAQMVLTREDQSVSWKVLRVFTYHSIGMNLVAAGSATWATHRLAWMRLSLNDTSTPHVNTGEGDGEHGEAAFMRANPVFKFQYTLATRAYILGVVSTLAAILAWIWLSMSQQEGIALFVLVIPPFFYMAWPYFGNPVVKLPSLPWT